MISILQAFFHFFFKKGQIFFKKLLYLWIITHQTGFRAYSLFMQASDFIEGQVLLVDKPLGWTSFDVVNKLRYALKRRLGLAKFKVGHAGTLDPLASGLLLICTGKATKNIEQLQGLNKSYSGTFQLGATTPSYDAETEPDEFFPLQAWTKQELDQVAQAFLGEQEQYPPVFSAIKVDGQPLYKKARKGEAIEVQARKVRIDRFVLTRWESPQLDFEVDCAKGTYIRSLAYDFGRALNNGAYLKALKRTAIGPHQLHKAWQLNDLIQAINLMPNHDPKQ